MKTIAQFILHHRIPLSPSRLRALCQNGTVPAQLIADRWMITDEDAALTALAARNTRPGWPVGRSKKAKPETK
jgi:hypothetical protein